MAQDATSQPNILLVVVDCARADAWLGPDRATVTPNLDKLCGSGISFPNTITEKSCTTPSFATLLTGLYSPRHGVHLVWGYRLAEGVTPLTQALAGQGYHTYAEVTGPLLPETGLDRAFDHYAYRAPCDYLHTAWGDRLLARLGSGYYKPPWLIMLHLWELHTPRQVLPEFQNARFGRSDYERSVSSLDAQLGRLFDAAGERSLVVFTSDHGEKTELETYRDETAVAYACDLLGVDEAQGLETHQITGLAGPSVLQQFYGQCAEQMKEVKLRDKQPARRYGWWVRLRDRLRLLRLAPMVYLHDLFALGVPLKLTAMLERRGLLDAVRAKARVDRLVRSVGRQGLLDMHMRMWINSYKNNLVEGHMVHVYDFLVRVPLVMRWSGRMPKGVIRSAMVRETDILPTILDLLGVDDAAYSDTDGRSLRPLIEGGPWQTKPAFVSVSGLPTDLEIAGVRTEEFKYTFGPHNPELPEELYDLRQDPGEARNCAAEQPDRCAALRDLALQHWRRTPQGGVEVVPYDPDQQQHIEAHLKELGYIE